MKAETIPAEDLWHGQEGCRLGGDMQVEMGQDWGECLWNIAFVAIITLLQFSRA